jgi:hypothetical protein
MQKWGTYLPFDSLFLANQYAFGPDYAPMIAERNFADKIKDVILVMNMPLQDPRLQAQWKVLYAGGRYGSDGTPPMKSQESYIIYQHQ